MSKSEPTWTLVVWLLRFLLSMTELQWPHETLILLPVGEGPVVGRSILKILKILGDENVNKVLAYRNEII